MAFQATPADITVIISTAGASSASIPSDAEPSLATERRITPSWTVSQLKGKLETMTGVPPGSQRLRLRCPGRADQWMDGDDRIVSEWGLFKGSEIEVHDTRPAAMRPNFNDVSSVEKYVLPTETYESLPNSVLAWKKNQKLGRFDPNAQTPEDLVRKQAEKDQFEVMKKGIAVDKRAIILPSEPPHIRRGTVRYVGPVPEIPFPGVKEESDLNSIPLPLWVGVQLDEPTGKNDGSVNSKRYFNCPNKMGVFVKPEKVEVGDFPPLGLDDLDDELMEEI